MEISCSVVFVSLFVSISIASILSLLRRRPSPPPSPPLLPSPFRVPIIGSLLWLRTSSFTGLEPIVRNLHAKYGPIITLHIASFPVISISDRVLAHQALVQDGTVFSDRPNALSTSKLINSHQDNITSALYGSTWRLLRRNLSSEMFHPARIQSFSGPRKGVLKLLISNLKSCSESRKSIRIIDHLQHAMFHLLGFMCFGEDLHEEKIKDIERVQRRLLSNFSRFTVLSILPKVSRIIFPKRRQEFLQLQEEQGDIMGPLIRARRMLKEERVNKTDDNNNNEFLVSYVDALLDLQWPEEKRKLEKSEIMTLCSEFMNAGTDTTATALEWILAHLVKYPEIQHKLGQEIRQVMSEQRDMYEEKVMIKEEDLSKMPYLKAVILEGLRRHPPAHFLIPHGVSKDVILNGYLVPKKGAVNFMVADMGWDPEVWEDPMAFKPERFLNRNEKNIGEDEALFDITGSKEIKMMPFGVGRRMCPGYNLAMLHLGYLIANLIWNFEWKASEDDDDVDFSENHQFTVAMKKSLEACIYRRSVA